MHAILSELLVPSFYAFNEGLLKKRERNTPETPIDLISRL